MTLWHAKRSCIATDPCWFRALNKCAAFVLNSAENNVNCIWNYVSCTWRIISLLISDGCFETVAINFCWKGCWSSRHVKCFLWHCISAFSSFSADQTRKSQNLSFLKSERKHCVLPSLIRSGPEKTLIRGQQHRYCYCLFLSQRATPPRNGPLTLAYLRRCATLHIAREPWTASVLSRGHPSKARANQHLALFSWAWLAQITIFDSWMLISNWPNSSCQS
jgi:hypothetical protein